MSWSFPDRMPVGRLTRRFGHASLLLGVIAASPVAAAEVYWQPIVSLQAETDSNLELDPGVRQYTEGYLADAATIVGIATPDSNTTFKPRLVYAEYPQNSLDDRLEGYFDLNSSIRTTRSNANILGSYRHVDEFNAELTSPVINEINPAQPTQPETGRVTTGASEDVWTLDPTYSYKLTPIISAGANGVYQSVAYKPAIDLSHSDFNYYQGRAFLNWSFSQRSDIALGAFGSKFQVTHEPSEGTGTGATLDLNTNWTPTFYTHAEVLFQHTSINDQVSTNYNGVTRAWGGTFNIVYKTQVSEFHLNASRTITPSGASTLYTVDTLQFQYKLSQSARWQFTGAVIGLHTRALNVSATNDDRSYAQVLLQEKWMMTPNWFLQGGYQYQWQKYQTDTISATNDRIFLRIGYQGLPKQ